MISVIMPTYNREKTLNRAIDSVLNQTYKNLELIIIDDNSNDKTYDIVNRYNDIRLKYIRLRENHGACYARNIGIKSAKGEYIAFQDSDDEWKPNKLEMQLTNMKKNDSDFDFCGYERYDGSSYLVMPNNVVRRRFTKNSMNLALSYGNFISTQLILAKKCCFDNDCLFDVNLPRLQDYDFVLRISENHKISFTDSSLAILYVQEDSISRSNEKLLSAASIFETKNYKYKNIVMSNIYSQIAKLHKNSKKERTRYYLKALHSNFTIKNILKVVKSFMIK